MLRPAATIVALIACALVLIPGGVNAHGNIFGLGVDQHFDFGGLPVEALLRVTDLVDGITRRIFDGLRRDAIRPPHFARKRYVIGRRQGFHRDARIGVGGEKQIDNRIRNAVADFIRMTFGNGFAGEQIIRRTGHRIPL